MIAAVRRRSLWDMVGTVVALAGVSLPGFWLGLILIVVFAVNLKALPVAGRLGFGTGLEPRTGFLLWTRCFSETSRPSRKSCAT